MKSRGDSRNLWLYQMNRTIRGYTTDMVAIGPGGCVFGVRVKFQKSAKASKKIIKKKNEIFFLLSRDFDQIFLSL